MNPRCRPLIVVVLLAAGAVGCRETMRNEPPQVYDATPQMIPVGPVPGPGSARPLPENPFHGDDAALVEGRRLFVRFNCSGCHGGHAGGGMGPSLRDQGWIYGGSAARIRDSIAHGRAHGMPAWGTTLPEQYTWKLTAYIQSLGTPREPEAPQ
jgi:cytochrome c oxidase cbb3-type subunit 3